MNKWRSRTAEQIYRGDPRLEVRSAGLRTGAVHVLSEADLDWADLVLVMERTHRRELRERFAGRGWWPPVEVLEIPDDFPFMDETLQRLLRVSADPVLDAAWESSVHLGDPSQDSG